MESGNLFEVTIVKNKLKTLNSCRTCMASEDKMNDIFSQHNGIAIKIHYCTGLVVNNNDKLPSLICDKCLHNLITAYHFKTKSLQSDKALRDILLNNKEEKTEEIETMKIKTEDLEQIIDIESKNNKWNNEKCSRDNINCKSSDFNGNKDVDKTNNDLRDSIGEVIDQNDVMCQYLTVAIVHDKPQFSFDDEIMNNDTNTLYGLPSDGIQEEPDCDTKDGISNIIGKEEKVDSKSNLRKNISIESVNNTSVAAMKIQSLPEVSVIKQEKPQVKSELQTYQLSQKQVTPTEEVKLQKSKKQCASKSSATSVSNNKRQSLLHMKPCCILCFIKFNTAEELEQHRIATHNKELEQHRIATHNKDKVISSKDTKVIKNRTLNSCIHCNIKFKTVKELRKHSKENHNVLPDGTVCKQVEPTLTLTCFLCNIKFNTIIEFHEHGKEKHSQNEESSAEETVTKRNTLKLNCVTCNKHFRSAKGLQKHTKENHSQSGCESLTENTLRKPKKTLNTTCSECDIKFESIIKYHQHRREKHNQEGAEKDRIKDIKRSLKCIPCNLTFNTNKEKRKHVRTTCIQSSQDGVMCEICGKCLRSRMSLYTHALSHAPAAHACPHCPYRAALVFDLRKHMNVHTGEKNYKCKLCPRAFATSSNLRLHERRWHTKEHRYQCPDCSKSFYDITSLKRHSTSHSGAAKQFQCDYCSSQFMHRNHWRRHVLSQHNIQVPKITVGRKKINYIPQFVDDSNSVLQNIDSIKGTTSTPNTN